MKKVEKCCVFSLLIMLAFACCTSLRNDTSSQKYAEYSVRTFPEYAEFMSEKFAITCKMPSRFFDQEYAELWKIRENRPAAFRYNPILRSKDKDCLIMFPFVPIYMSEIDYQVSKATSEINKIISDNTVFASKPTTNESVPRNTINFEIRTALEIDKDALFDFNDHVTVLAGKEVRDMFNADSVFLYNIPMDRPYKEKYTHCTGVIISKMNRPTLALKWFFTDYGKKRETEYIARLRKAIWYHEELN